MERCNNTSIEQNRTKASRGHQGKGHDNQPPPSPHPHTHSWCTLSQLDKLGSGPTTHEAYDHQIWRCNYLTPLGEHACKGLKDRSDFAHTIILYYIFLKFRAKRIMTYCGFECRHNRTRFRIVNGVDLDQKQK
jgi:hypothetical protein